MWSATADPFLLTFEFPCPTSKLVFKNETSQDLDKLVFELQFKKNPTATKILGAVAPNPTFSSA